MIAYKIFKELYKINYPSFFNFRRLSRFLKVIKQIRILKPKKIADLACGIAPYTLYLSRNNYLTKGIDLDENLIKKAKSFDSRLDLSVGSIFNTKFKKDSFDLVLMSEILEHLKYQDKAINEANKILRKEGFLLITVPTLHFYYSYPQDNHINSKITQKYIKKLLNDKFEIISVDYFGSFFENLWRAIYFKLFKKKQNNQTLLNIQKNKLFKLYKYAIFPFFYIFTLLDLSIPSLKPLHMMVLAKKKK